MTDFKYDTKTAWLIFTLLAGVCLSHLYIQANAYQTGAFALAALISATGAIFVSVHESDEKEAERRKTLPCGYCGRGRADH